jgi:hypothetical protein
VKGYGLLPVHGEENLNGHLRRVHGEETDGESRGLREEMEILKQENRELKG